MGFELINVVSTLVVEIDINKYLLLIEISEHLENPVRIKGLPLDAVNTRAVTRKEEEHAAQASSSSPALPVLAGYTLSFIWDSHG